MCNIFILLLSFVYIMYTTYTSPLSYITHCMLCKISLCIFKLWLFRQLFHRKLIKNLLMQNVMSQ